MKGGKTTTKKYGTVTPKYGRRQSPVQGNIACTVDEECRTGKRSRKWVCCPEEIGGKVAPRALTCQEAQMMCMV